MAPQKIVQTSVYNEHDIMHTASAVLGVSVRTLPHHFHTFPYSLSYSAPEGEQAKTTKCCFWEAKSTKQGAIGKLYV